MPKKVQKSAAAPEVLTKLSTNKLLPTEMWSSILEHVPVADAVKFSTIDRSARDIFEIKVREQYTFAENFHDAFTTYLEYVGRTRGHLDAYQTARENAVKFLLEYFNWVNKGVTFELGPLRNSTELTADVLNEHVGKIIQEMPVHECLLILEVVARALVGKTPTVTAEVTDGGKGFTLTAVCQTTVFLAAPFGIGLEESDASGIMVVEAVNEGRNADKSGKVHVGMQIVSVNGNSTKGLRKAEVSELIKDCEGAGKVPVGFEAVGDNKTSFVIQGSVGDDGFRLQMKTPPTYKRVNSQDKQFWVWSPTEEGKKYAVNSIAQKHWYDVYDPATFDDKLHLLGRLSTDQQTLQLLDDVVDARNYCKDAQPAIDYIRAQQITTLKGMFDTVRCLKSNEGVVGVQAYGFVPLCTDHNLLYKTNGGSAYLAASFVDRCIGDVCGNV